MQESVNQEPIDGEQAASGSKDPTTSDKEAQVDPSFAEVVKPSNRQIGILRIFLLLLLSLPVLALVGLTVIAAFFGTQSRDYELMTHLRFQFAIILLGLFVVTAIARARLLLILVVVALVINLSEVVPLYIPSDHDGRRIDPAPVLAQTGLTVVSSNLNVYNKEYEKIARAFDSSGADIICLQELTPEASDFLIASTKSVYPHTFMVPQPGMFGAGILSKVPLTNTEKLYLSEAPDIPTLKATAMIHGRPITILDTHPIAPLGEPTFKIRNEQLDNLADLAAKSKDPVILVGDLNVTPFSPFFKRLVQAGGYFDTTPGFGFQPSWQAQGFPFNKPIDQILFNLPLDHVLVRGPFKTMDRRILDSIGSDHKPVKVTLTLE